MIVILDTYDRRQKCLENLFLREKLKREICMDINLKGE